jgi:hypothetical protein
MEHMPKSPFPIDDVFPSDRVAEDLLGYKRVDSSDGETQWKQVRKEAANDDVTLAPPSHDRPTVGFETLRSPEGHVPAPESSTTIRIDDRSLTEPAPKSSEDEGETAA